MATPQRVAAELGRMSVLCRQQMSQEELRALVPVWTKLTAELSDQEFTAAVMAHARESPYFPAPAHVLRAHAALCAEALAKERRAAITTREQEGARNPLLRLYADMLAASLEGKKAARVFFSPLAWEERLAAAREVLGDLSPYLEEKGNR